MVSLESGWKEFHLLPLIIIIILKYWIEPSYPDSSRYRGTFGSVEVKTAKQVPS